MTENVQKLYRQTKPIHSGIYNSTHVATGVLWNGNAEATIATCTLYKDNLGQQKTKCTEITLKNWTLLTDHQLYT